MVGYLVKEGVRRAVAAHRAGRTDIAVVIEEPGQPDTFTRLPFTALVTTKASVPRDARYIRDVEYPTAVLGTEPPPIAVEPIHSAQRVKHLTRIDQVVLS